VGTSSVAPPPYGPPWAPYAEPKPVAAFVISLVAGILILLGGGFEIWAGYLVDQAVITFGVGDLFLVLGAVGVGLGVLIVGLSVALFLHPRYHRVLGILILVLALLSSVAYWGFLVGLILGVVGGVLAIVWDPSRSVPSSYVPAYFPAPQQSPGQYGTVMGVPATQRVCLKCGRFIGSESRFCPHCGNSLGG
jgi:Family of unknown function (DUF6114)